MVMVTAVLLLLCFANSVVAKGRIIVKFKVDELPVVSYPTLNEDHIKYYVVHSRSLHVYLVRESAYEKWRDEERSISERDIIWESELEYQQEVVKTFESFQFQNVPTHRYGVIFLFKSYIKLSRWYSGWVYWYKIYDSKTVWKRGIIPNIPWFIWVNSEFESASSRFYSPREVNQWWRMTASVTCEDGGTRCLCKEQLPYYTCSKQGIKFCAPQYTGDNCKTDVDECAKIPSPCKHKSKCINTYGGFKCDCNGTGYEGEICDREINECARSYPCRNGATCTNTPGSYNCSCTTGFMGEDCKFDVNECASSRLCENDGQCLNTYGNYTCHCKKGFEGRHCHEDINECLLPRKHPLCENGGFCVNNFGSFRCICPANFTGSVCADDVNECDSLPCPSYEECKNTYGSYQCSCAYGFEGPRCSDDINECDDVDNFCKNNATCENLVGKFICHCSPGYQGTNCDMDVNECEKQDSCFNGTCLNFDGGYNCTCRYPYIGERCEYRNVGTCFPATCKNGGSCIHFNEGSSCLCVKGYTGDYCQRDINECERDPGPCSHGKCINTNGSFECECKKYYQGQLCNKRVNLCSDSPCMNGGSCEESWDNGNPTVTCKCLKKYTGNHCEFDEGEECNDFYRRLCQNNSTCVFTQRSYICLCKKGYFGLQCRETKLQKGFSNYIKFLFAMGIILVLVIFFTLGNLCLERIKMSE